MIGGYQLTVDQLLRFFQLSHALNLQTREDRLNLLRAMRREGMAVFLRQDDLVKRLKNKRIAAVKKR